MELRYKWPLLTIVVLFSVLCKSCQFVEPRYNFPNSDVYIKLEKSNNLQYVIMKGSKRLQTVTLDAAVSSESPALLLENDHILLNSAKDSLMEFSLLQSDEDFTLVHVNHKNLRSTDVPKDCIDLEIGELHWYGGPQHRRQYWPVERGTYSNYSYLTKEEDNVGIAERYWLNSRGVFFYIEDETPLFIEQNSEGHENQLCFKAQKALPYDIHDLTKFHFNYKIGIGMNAKEAHLKAVKAVLGKPAQVVDERMVRHPIWSTWALYKTEIDDGIVREFAADILKYGFQNSQLEIDDDWEDCYGALTFRKNKFPNIKSLTNDLKALGFRVTLWVHPFINKNCTATYNEAKSKGYLVVNQNGDPETQWWNSVAKDAAYIDFSNEAAAEWYTTRLKRLQTEDGIDNFKFDAGESSWVPRDPVLKGDSEFSPSIITRDYIKTVSKFGELVEVRSGQGTQSIPIFLRMIDKDSEWNWNNGLPTLVTTLMQLNIAGYPFVLPDMIGGNGYNEHPPNKELFIRWLQANIFMPSLQFSYVPWNFDDETIRWSLSLTKLHDEYTGYIMSCFQKATETGAPPNPPLWWIAPEDRVAQGIYDQFLLGEDIISAPVLGQGQTERDIYLPRGYWLDGNNGKVHKGPKWIMSYPAPLNVLPYFVRTTGDGK